MKYGVAKLGGIFAAIFGSGTIPPTTLPAGAGNTTLIALAKAQVNLFVAHAELIAGTIEAPGALTQKIPVLPANRYFKNHVFTFTVASLDTNVTMGIVGKALAEADFRQASDNNTVITADGDYLVKIKDTPLEEVGLRMIAESGGTGVVISNINYRGQN